MPDHTMITRLKAACAERPPEHYHCIRAWGVVHNRGEAWIEATQHAASVMNAPPDALFQLYDEHAHPINSWCCCSDLWDTHSFFTARPEYAEWARH